MKKETVPHGSTGDNVRASALEDVKRLAVFAPNWLGDAIMALPALADVRRTLPSVSIAVVARQSVAPLFSLVPGVDELMFLSPREAGADPIVGLRGGRLDAVILLTNSFRTAMMAWRAGIPERWGYRSDWRGPLLTRAVARPGRGHQAHYYQRLVAELGFRNGPQRPQLTVPDDVRAAASLLLREAGWDSGAPLVAIAPGAAYGSAKRWPSGSFAALASALIGEHATVVLVGSDADRAAAEEVKKGVGSPLVDLVGRTELPALAGVFVHCRALVTNDSGAMHMAAALDVPVVALFGPTNERETRPLGSAPATVLTSQVWCRPCMLRDCPIDHRCMRGITVETVLSATYPLLR